MNLKTLRALIAFNVVLLLSLVMVTLTPAPAQGQFAGAEFIMVSGQTAGRAQQNVVYIINLNTAQMAAVIYNSADNSFTVVDAVNMMNDLQAK